MAGTRNQKETCEGFAKEFDNFVCFSLWF